MSTPPSRLRRRALLSLGLTVALGSASGCGVQVNAHAGSSSMGSSSHASTGGGSGRTTGSTGGSSPTTSTTPATTTTTTPIGYPQLEPLFPKASDIGPDYRMAPRQTSGDDSVLDRAFTKACPAYVARFGHPFAKSTLPTFNQGYTTTDHRQFRVVFHVGEKAPVVTDLATRISAFNACPAVHYAASGYQYAVTIRYQAYPGLGPNGILATEQIQASGGPTPNVPAVTATVAIFTVGRVRVSVEATDGISVDSTGHLVVVPRDLFQVDPIAKSIQAQLKTLTH